MAKSTHYRPEIDGLRAVAVVAVILFHAGLETFAGGFIGVDVFFVISGFLIYSIILDKIDGPGFSYVDFYNRRVRRIAPALIVVVALTIPAAWLILDPVQFKDFGQSVGCSILFCANFLFWSEADYFAHAAELKPLLHTWSLSVEEQFYLIFPTIAVVFGAKSPRVRLILFASLAALSLALTSWTYDADPSAAFYLLHTRAWELLVGVMAAIIARNMTKRSMIVADVGLAMVVGSIFLLGPETPVPSIYCVPAVVGTALILLHGGPVGIAGNVLSWRPVVAVGLASYSAYLLHQPMIALSRLAFAPSEVWLLVIALFAVPLGFLSYRYVERPFRATGPDGAFRIKAPALTGYLLVSATVLLGLAVTAHVRGGFPDRIAPNGRAWAELGLERKLAPNRGLAPVCDVSRELSVEEVLAKPACRTKDNPEILLWGDSFAMHLAQMLEAGPLVRSKGLVQATRSQCPPILDLGRNASVVTAADCIGFNDAIMEFIEHSPSLRYVVLSSPFAVGGTWENSKGQKVESAFDAMGEGLQRTVDRIRALGKQVIVVGPTPRDGTNHGYCLKGNFARDVPLEACDFAQAEMDPKVTASYAMLEVSTDGATLIDLRNVLCHEEVCRVSLGGTFIYRDWGHLSAEGSQLVGKNLADVDTLFE
jgi:peptidoglycan/LPS O-acetylase OafA/YrhL